MSRQDSFSLRDVFRRERLPSLVGAFLLLGVAYVAEHFANVYALDYLQRPDTNHVGDIVLDNLPAIGLNFVIIDIALAAIVLGTLFVVFARPRYILFSLKAVALFVIVRAFFISLTHVGIHPDTIAPGPGFLGATYLYLNFQTGFFFSGHTGLPFLMALIFWDDVRARYAFLALSFVFAVAALFAHIHYSIDVFAAPFMAYGIFNIACYLFRKDHALMVQ